MTDGFQSWRQRHHTIGTDNDLSGLSGIAGVTVRNFNGYTQNDIGSLRMVINGTRNIAQSNTLGDFEQ